MMNEEERTATAVEPIEPTSPPTHPASDLEEEAPRSSKGVSYEPLIKLLIFIFFVHTFLVQSYVIPTSSMENTLLVGDHIMVDKVVYSRSYNAIDGFFLPQKKIQRGMIVAFKAPNNHKKLYVKRVIGMPGDLVYIRYQKVYINNKPLDEPYVIHSDKKRSNMPGRDNFPKYKVPEGHYFCMGDNRDDSLDSRRWGSVPQEFIVGAPWRIYWSYRTNGKEYMNTNFFQRLEDIFLTVFNIIPGTRWERTTMRVH